MSKLLERVMSYPGYSIYALLENKPQDWKISEDMSKAYLWFGDGQKLALRVGYGFSRFDIADQDSIEELTFIDKLILWPKVRRIRTQLMHSYMETLL